MTADLSLLPEWAREAYERAEKATAGPWAVHWWDDGDPSVGVPHTPYVGFAGGTEIATPNRNGSYEEVRNLAAFIAAAREDVPRLCKALAEALAKLETVRCANPNHPICTPDEEDE